MKKVLNIFLLAIAAGICIGIGGTVYLSVVGINKIVASCLFALGLFTIICYQFSLFTGKVGYLFENKVRYLLDLGIIWIGNFLGTCLVGFLFRQTRFFTPEIQQTVNDLIFSKQNDSVLSILILSFFCGMLMYIAVNTQKKENIAPVFKLIAIFFCVMVFILCGFEHVVANMYYLAASGQWSLKIILYLLLMTLGNGLGSITIWLFEHVLKKKEN